MPDLYSALGVPKDADHAAIRRAYRDRAKKAHPDTGGSPKQFALVKLAHDTLTDDARRAKYDATGEVDENPIDNARAQLLEMLAAGLDMALAKLFNQSKPPIHNDMASLTRNALREMRTQLTAERRNFEKQIVIAKELQGRWTAKGENMMETLVGHRIKVCEGNVTMLTGRIALVDRALEVLDGVSFRFDQPRPQSPAEAWITNGMQSGMLNHMLGGRL